MELSTDHLREAAAGLRRIIEAVEDGRLVAPTSHEVALIRRIQGAATALDAATTREFAPPPS